MLLSNTNICTIALVISLLLLLVVVVLVRQEPPKMPKVIWTYWNDPRRIPEVVSICMDSWRKHNPSFKIVVLNDDNQFAYTGLDFADGEKHGITSSEVQKKSDLIRMTVLSERGGVWMDASILCLEPLTELLPSAHPGVDYVGFFISSFTTRASSPVVENWFFAANRGCRFLKLWKEEFARIDGFDSADAYVRDVVESGVDLQKIDGPTYLSNHVAAQKVCRSPTSGSRPSASSTRSTGRSSTWRSPAGTTGERSRASSTPAPRPETPRS